MDSKAALEALIGTLPLMPLESVDSVLVSLDLLLGYSEPEVRVWAAEAIRQAAQSAAFPGAKDRLLRLSETVAAGQPAAPPPTVQPVDWLEEPAAAVPAPAAKSPRKPGKLAEFKSLHIRKASVVVLGGFKPTFDPIATKFGSKPAARPGESWPSIYGKPMLFVCQLNLATAPEVPKLLEGIKLLTFFLEFRERKDGDGGTDWRFEIRTYESTRDLATLDPPPDAPALRKWFECTWQSVDDYPCPEDPDARNPRELESPNAAATKIGGWPALIQSELSWQTESHPAKPVYCLQIASEGKAALSFGDNGTLYLARGTAPGYEREWFLDWQSR